MLDPIEFAKQLEKSGLPRQAAELIAKGYSHLPSNLATKEDISKLEGRVDRLDARLDRLEGKIEKNTQDIAALKEQMLNLKYLV